MIWKKGDIITRGRYNKVRSSYAGLPKSVALHLTTVSSTKAVLDKTKDEIVEFLKLGYIVYIISNSNQSIDYITFVSDTQVETSQGLTYDVQPSGEVSLRLEIQD